MDQLIPEEMAVLPITMIHLNTVAIMIMMTLRQTQCAAHVVVAVQKVEQFFRNYFNKLQKISYC